MGSYIVSARKYRPESFETLIGQDTIAQALRNSILRGQLSHAYLFCGPRGVGKTTTARIFAKMINCSNPSESLEPCGQCESCVSFAENRSYCIHELDAASNNSVEDIKALMDQVMTPPQVGRYSVYIIDEVHMLSTAAFNAFLKTLEEPPAHAIFILATTEKHKILPTILSRCQTYDFNRIGIADIVRNVRSVAEKEGVDIDDESLHVIAQKADGAMRDALTIFDQCVAFCGTTVRYKEVVQNLNVIDLDYVFTLTDNFLSGDFASAFTIFDEVLSKGFNALSFVAAISQHLRNLSICKVSGDEKLLEVADSVAARYREQATRCSMRFIFQAMNTTSACEAGYRAAVNQRLHIELTLMRLCYIENVPEGAQPQAQLQPQAQPQPKAPSPVQTQTKVQDTPQQSAHEPAQPVTQTDASQPRRRRANAAASGLSAFAAISADVSQQEVTSEEKPKEEAPLPSEERMRQGWKHIVMKHEKNSPRLFAVLYNAGLSFESVDDGIELHFTVANVAQRDWIISKRLRDLEEDFRSIVGSTKVYLRADVAPEDPSSSEKKLYMPEDQAKALIAKDDNVRTLVDTLGLQA